MSESDPSYSAPNVCPVIETTKTTVADMLNWSRDIGRREYQRNILPSEVAQFRSAMAAMSNVMRQVDAVGWRTETDLHFYTEAQQTEKSTAPLRIGAKVIDTHEQARAEWSRRVRAGVAALPKPGPVVACQGDYDDE